MNGLIPLYFQKNLNKQISKLISFIGKSILASGLQKHAIYALAVKVYKATQKHRADAFHLHKEISDSIYARRIPLS